MESQGTIEFIAKTPRHMLDHNHGVLESKMTLEDTGHIKDVINAFKLFLVSQGYGEALVEDNFNCEQ